MHFPRTAPADTEGLPPGAAAPPPQAGTTCFGLLRGGQGGRLQMNELADEVVLSGTGRVRLVDGIDAAYSHAFPSRVGGRAEARG
jgi:hypothetical protein